MGATAGGAEKTDKVLKRMEREGYVIRVKEASGTGEDDVYWVVGPRGKVEVGDAGSVGLVEEVYGAKDMQDEDAAELERRIARSLGIGEAVPTSEKQTASDVVNGGKRRGRKRKDELQEAERAEDVEEESSSDEE